MHSVLLSYSSLKEGKPEKENEEECLKICGIAEAEKRMIREERETMQRRHQTRQKRATRPAPLRLLKASPVFLAVLTLKPSWRC